MPGKKAAIRASIEGALRVNPLALDLEHILEHTGLIWEELRGQRIFITGGTGFLGCWLLESFAWANETFKLGASAVVLTREPEVFRRKAPHLYGYHGISLHSGDVRSFAYPEGTYGYLIHAATQSSTNLNVEDPLLMLDTIVQGTRHTLEFARRCGAKKVLYTSSGAVYGSQPTDMTQVSEEYPGSPDPMSTTAAYGQGKRTAEFLCSSYARQYGLQTKIARCFAFVGPYLPLEAHFAVGNFIRDGLAGGPIKVLGDGSPYRSYLYAADLAIWLWTILIQGVSARPYNVGSEQAITIGDLAGQVALAFHPPLEVHIAQPRRAGEAPERYVPATRRARLELGLKENVGLQEAINRTIEWHRGLRQKEA